MIVIKRDVLTAEEFIDLWESVWDGAPACDQTKLALEHSAVTLTAFDGDVPVGMARAIGDMGLCYYIKDVVVIPSYQGMGIGRMMIDELLAFIKENGVRGTDIAVELCAMPDKIPFYEKFGFAANEAQRLRRYLEV
ncbi:MAG: GNAT family N-acetyltransferase [Oscillospiraceae bacterium]|nr:GNAT family N-acetyltransferase [Oscillospiraceae bacterium]